MLSIFFFKPIAFCSLFILIGTLTGCSPVYRDSRDSRRWTPRECPPEKPLPNSPITNESSNPLQSIIGLPFFRFCLNLTLLHLPLNQLGTRFPCRCRPPGGPPNFAYWWIQRVRRTPEAPKPRRLDALGSPSALSSISPATYLALVACWNPGILHGLAIPISHGRRRNVCDNGRRT